MNPQTGLSTAIIDQLVSILDQNPVRSIILFGSRAKGNFREGSDIDLCVDAPGLQTNQLLQMKAEVDALDLPWMVDIVHMQSIDNEALLKHIQQFGITLKSVTTA